MHTIYYNPSTLRIMSDLLPREILLHIFNFCDNPIAFLQICKYWKNIITREEVKVWLKSHPRLVNELSDYTTKGFVSTRFRLCVKYQQLETNGYYNFILYGDTSYINIYDQYKLRKLAYNGYLSPRKRMTLFLEYKDIDYLVGCTYKSFLKAKDMWENVKKEDVLELYLSSCNLKLSIHSYIGSLVFKMYGVDAIRHIQSTYVPGQAYKIAMPVLIASGKCHKLNYHLSTYLLNMAKLYYQDCVSVRTSGAVFSKQEKDYLICIHDNLKQSVIDKYFCAPDDYLYYLEVTLPAQLKKVNFFST